MPREIVLSFLFSPAPSPFHLSQQPQTQHVGFVPRREMLVPQEYIYKAAGLGM